MNITVTEDLGADALRHANTAALRSLQIDPYPAEAFNPTMSIGAALADATQLIEKQRRLRFAGRITGIRKLGRSVFLDLLHDDERLQLFIGRDKLDARSNAVMNHTDRGDFLGAEGMLFVTQRGEISLAVERLTMLGKPVRSPPIGKRTAEGRVHQALGDTGQLLRNRHVALLSDREFRKRILERSRIIGLIRRYFEAEGFVEIDTPILAPAYGGAAARPFVTQSQALGENLFLRVSPECHLKRALCGGLPKVFEIGKNFRNEGIDHSHNPEFTALEWYEAFSDYEGQMKRFEKLVSGIAMDLHGTYWVHFRGRSLDFSPPWPRLRVLDAVAEALRCAPDDVDLQRLQSAWRDKASAEGLVPSSWGEALMAVFEAIVEPELIGPVFVIDHPVEVSPLTKRHRKDPRLVERFEPFAGGMELGNAYSELNDPVEQRDRLEGQDARREERYGVDEAFLRAIEDGMPQAGGAGLGVDRLVMLLTDAQRLSDVVLFPAG